MCVMSTARNVFSLLPTIEAISLAILPSKGCVIINSGSALGAELTPPATNCR